MLRIVFDGTASLVGEFAEIDFESVRRGAQHVDIGARTENTRLQTCHDDGAHFRMLEANPLDGVRQFDIDAQVIRIQFELVTLGERLVFLHVHREPGHRAFDRKFPVPVLIG